MSTSNLPGPVPVTDRNGRPVLVADRQPMHDRTGAVLSVMGSGLRLLVRFVHLVVSVVVLIIVAGILLVMLKANPTNAIVSDVHGWAHWLAGPFDGMFSFHDARTAVAVNWGIAAVVYLFVGELIARLISGTRRWRPLDAHYSPTNQENS
jgi:hypothetical protein